MYKKYRSGFAKSIFLLLLLVTILPSCNSYLTLTPVTRDLSSLTPTDALTLAPISTKTLPACVPVSNTVVVPATLQPTQITTCIPSVNPAFDYEFISLECRKEECLFINKAISDLPVGLATIEGYYAKSDHVYLDGNTYSCDSFVVVEGSLFIFVSLNNLMYQKNSRVRNEQNHPMITIDLKGLEPSDATLIKAATSDKPVSLWIMLHVPLQMGSHSPCQTDIEILKVEPVKKP